MASKSKAGRSARPDLATLAGVVIALGGIFGGMTLEHGKIADIAQLTALLIVGGGTLGATLVSTPLGLFLRAVGRLKAVLFDTAVDPSAVLEELIGYATKARKTGL